MTDAGKPSAVLRRERAQRAVARLAEDVERWSLTWDGRREHASQLQRLHRTLRALIDRLRKRAAALGMEAFADARRLDADVAVAERLWRYFADRFDQRRDAALAPILRAADDILWACTTRARALAAADAPAIPLPLAYVEPSFAPTAIPRSAAPIELAAADPALQRVLAVLPVPLVGLPTGVVEEPWWLVLLAHELGHHVQYELEPGQALVERTADELARAVGAAWRAWGREVFADAFAVAIAGEAVVLAIVELEWDAGPAMLAGRPGYPPALARIALAAALAARFGYGDGGVPARLAAVARALVDGAAAARAQALLAEAAAAAQAMAAMPLGGAASLATLADRVRNPDEAEGLAAAVASDAVVPDAGALQPLRAVAAGFAAYRGLAAVADDDARAKARRRLRGRLDELLVLVREPGVIVRGTAGAAAAASAAVDDDEALLDRLARLLPGHATATAAPAGVEAAR
jgi:hypothetical protein